MQVELARPFDRISFSRQFMLLTLGILVASMLVVGIWLERQFAHSAANHAAGALYSRASSASSLQIRRRPGGQRSRKRSGASLSRSPEPKIVRLSLRN
jgi:hypothetical protein